MASSLSPQAMGRWQPAGLTEGPWREQQPNEPSLKRESSAEQ
jgi:hypothetical protein